MEPTNPIDDLHMAQFKVGDPALGAHKEQVRSYLIEKLKTADEFFILTYHEGDDGPFSGGITSVERKDNWAYSFREVAEEFDNIEEIEQDDL